MIRISIIIYLLFLSTSNLQAQHIGVRFEVIETESSPISFSSKLLESLIYDSLELRLKNKLTLIKPQVHISKIDEADSDSMAYDYILQIQLKDSIWRDSSFLSFDVSKRIYQPKTDPLKRMQMEWIRLSYEDNRKEEDILYDYIGWLLAGSSRLISSIIPMSLTESTVLKNKKMKSKGNKVLYKTVIVNMDNYTEPNIYTQKLWILFNSVLASYQYYHDEVKTQTDEKLNIILFKDGRELKELNNHIEYLRISSTTINFNITKNSDKYCLSINDNAQVFIKYDNMLSVKSEVCFTQEQLINEPEVVHYQIYKNISTFFRLNL